MLKESLIENNSIRLGAKADSWQDAVKIGTDLLVASKAIQPKYYDKIISNVEELGDYIILAPGLAMPNAHPEDGVNKTAFSLVTLREPVYLDDTPIQVLFTMAAADNEAYAQSIMAITSIFEDDNKNTGVDIEPILACKKNKAVLKLLEKRNN